MSIGNKGGRPKADLPMNVIDAALAFNATLNQVVQVLASQGIKTTRQTVAKAINELHEISFEEYRDSKTDFTRLKLSQKAVKMAMDGNVTMLIFCLKNLCGWKDRNELTGANNAPVVQTSSAPQIIVTLPDNGRSAPESVITVEAQVLELAEDVDLGF